MRKVRIIPRLDIKGSNVVKGIHLEGLRVVGKPADLARKYYNEGADELIYMDIVASLYDRNHLSSIVEETIKKDVFIPVTVGGGIRSLEDIDKLLRSGADKVAINTAAVKVPVLLKQASRVYGSSTIVLSVEAKKIVEGKWEVYIENGREKTGRDVVEWIKEAVFLGAGEILLTSIDREGTCSGFELDLIEAVTSAVSVPVVVCGGAGSYQDVQKCIANEKIDGVAIASLLHYEKTTVRQLKSECSKFYKHHVEDNAHHDSSDNGVVDVDVSVVDYGLGNIFSVINALQQIGAHPKLIRSPEEVLNAHCIILPGVGSYEEGMRHLKERNLAQALVSYAQSGRPLLGICLGMQLLMTKSYEFGEHQGLNIIEGEVLPFAEVESLRNQGCKIPHVGWSAIREVKEEEGTILASLPQNAEAYFIHSYYVKPHYSENQLALTYYYGHKFCSVVRKGNTYGCQFHPEKSGQAGLNILRAFLNLKTKQEVLSV